MTDFARIPAPIGSPTTCPFCHTHADKRGFADRAIELPHYGRLQICAGCAISLGRLFGLVDPEKLQAAQDFGTTLHEENAELRRKLEEERMNKYVPLAEVIDFVAEHEKRRGYKPGEKPKAAV